MHRLDILALTPPGVCDSSIAIAACRAGARGFLDLQYSSDTPAALLAVKRLEQFTATPFGVKLGPSNGKLLESLLAEFPGRLKWVLLAGGEHAQLGSWIQQLHERDVEVFLEAIRIDEALLADRLGVDGIVLKGHEAGGRVGSDTAFILLQRWRQHVERDQLDPKPTWVQGGIGLNTTAAAIAGGATGVVLDSQLLLGRESPVDSSLRQRLAAMDGSETLCVGQTLGEGYRLYNRPGLTAVEELQQEAQRIESALETADERLEAWRDTAHKYASSQPRESLLFLGQDAALAGPLAERFVTVGGIIEALVEHAGRNLSAARRLKPLAEHTPLAAEQKTRYPILQGPMTRVSDTAPFAKAVADAGGLPFLALALLRRAEVEKLLAETRELVGDQSWGVGILGFLPPEIRKEQIEAILADRPPFALIAGGRPDQARELEEQGIPTYLHVPSPGLLRMFLRDGARRFVFEGRECGGHVGPRGSFLLWETMCETLLEYMGSAGKGDDLNIVFAGGIHDGLSAAMVAAMAAPLVERGVKIGVLMGTAYLFTREAVEAGAIVPRFQQAALGCRETVLLETGPGHAIRCVKTPYYDTFEAEKHRLRKEGKTHEEIVRALEWMNIGRLRVASKGLDRVASDDGPSKLSEVSGDQQFERGMYMIGQVSALRDSITSMAELHQEVSDGSCRRLDELKEEAATVLPAPEPCDIAIIGMSCFYPSSDSLRTYWENILNRVNAITEIPEHHWDWERYYDPDPRAPDKIISKWGGFLGDVPFDPISYGITPASVKVIEPLQLLMLEAVRHALADAGYAERPFNRERTCAVVGIGGGGSPMATSYGFRTCLPMFADLPGVETDTDRILEASHGLLPEWTEDSFPGFLMNVAVGRVANRFNFGGTNYAIDAACASSLAAVQACIRELQMGTSDFAVAMGADTVQTPFAYMAFSKTYALSKRGRCTPFDASADGIVLAEGIGVVALKRLADAERDGDQILAVIKGVGASSDGKDKGLTAPNSAGQTRALRRAYAQARLSPKRVGLIEAHGTGTVVGDRTEAESLSRVFHEAGAEQQSCALGSVKSMIGHSKCAAGLAGLIKTTLALHRKVLPPTLVDEPNPRFEFENSPLYLNTEARPWIHGAAEPRCAGVSAFGFGGTNFHIVLEEYWGDYLHEAPRAFENWPAELIVCRRSAKQEIIETLQQCQQALSRGAEPALRDLAAAFFESSPADPAKPTLAMVVTSLEDLREKLSIALQALRREEPLWEDPRGLYFAENPAAQSGKIALLFPGQGSQYPNMLSQVTMAFAEARETFDRAEHVLEDVLDARLAKFIFPPSTFGDEQEKAAASALARTEVAQPAIGAAGLAMYRILASLGVEADFLAGHSYGEYVALCAAGVLSEDDLIRISHRRGCLIKEASGTTAGAMAAIEADAGKVSTGLDGLEGVTLANINSPRQTVISGSEERIDAALARLDAAGIGGRRIAVSCAFHSPLVAPAAKALARELSQFRFAKPQHTVFSNTTGGPYPEEPEAIAALLAEHLKSPVRFQQQIEAMYEAGARTFVEVGPQGVLTGLVKQILEDRPHTAVASDIKGRPGLVQLAHLLGQLLVQGVPIELGRLFDSRVAHRFTLSELEQQTGKPQLSATTWIVNGARARPVGEPEPWLLGQRFSRSKTGDQMRSETQSSGAQPTAPHAKHPAIQEAPGAPAADLQPMPQHASLDDNDQRPAEPWQPIEVPSATDESTQVILGFQNLMARFLDTQRSVMLNYLQDSNGAPAAAGQEGHSQPASPEEFAGRTLPPVAASETASAAPPPDESAANEDGAEASQQEIAEPPAVPSDSAAAPAMSREELSAQLVELVSNRTGYPKEMLDLDLDLEADLGIDSIKRVEILGTLAEGLSETDETLESKIEIEKLTGIRTLRGIIEYLEEILFSDQTESASPTATREKEPSDNGQPTAVEGQLEVQRALVRLVDAPLSTRGVLSIPSGAVLFTDDGGGVARGLADRMADFGQQTALIRMSTTDGQDEGDGVFYADLTDADAVTALIDRVRQQLGPIGGLAHLLPLSKLAEGEDLAASAQRDVKSLYLLARALEDNLCRAGKDGSAFLLAASAMGGSLGFGDETLPEDFNPGHGGIAGFLKCLALEWPDVLVRAVDFDRTRPASELVDHLASELGDSEGPAEVGCRDKRRVTWEPYPAPLNTEEPTEDVITSDSTLLITGGARGITATIALELARRYKPTLIIAGRSPAPAEAEASDTADLTDTAEIKAALIHRMEAENGKVAPAAVEAEYQTLMRQREMRANLKGIRETGATVDYRQVDVRDSQAFGALIDEITEKFDGIDGVIHGAGVVEDKLVRDKTPESFDRVFNTKVASALTLSRHLDPNRLKFCALFVSVASRYGNRGQADYAAANEVLSKLAIELNRRWSARIFSIAWGPWSGVGMAANLEKHLTRRGLKLIDLQTGPKFLIEEILYGGKGDTEVIIAGGAERIAQPQPDTLQSAT